MTNVHYSAASVLCICLISVLLGKSTRVWAQEAFTPPQAYPLDRYEEGWSKNPFTLKTAPVALVQRSFAEDMAIGSYFGSKDNPTIVVVDVKTRKRWPIKKGQTAENGMTLESWSISSSRRETSAVVKLNGEKAELRFDDSFVKEMAASGTGPGTAAPAPRGAADPARPVNQGRQRMVGDVASDTATPADAAEARSSFPAGHAVADAGTGSLATAAGYTPSAARRMKFTSPIPRSQARRSPLPSQ